MNPVDATLYLPGRPAGMPCRVGFAGESLVIDCGTVLHVPAQSLRVETGGFDDDALQLHGTHRGEALTVVVTGATAQSCLAQDAPASLAAALRRGRGRVRYHRRKWQVVVGMLAAAVLAVLLGWWQGEAITAWLASRVPVAREQRLADMWLKQLQAEGGLRESGPALDAVRTIGQQLTVGSRYTYRWLVKDDPEVNAFAGPGGVVVVHTGLIAMTESPEQLAGVLAHETQHVEQRHVLQSMIHSAGWAALLTVALGDVSALTGVLIHQVGNLHHSRRLESQADAGGVAALARAGIDPRGMAAFLGKLRAQQQGADGAVIGLLSSHPATAERLAAVELRVRQTTCECRPLALALDWAAVRADVATPGARP